MKVALPELSAAKIAPWLMILIATAYFLFLIGTWMQFQSDRAIRDEKFDALLDSVSPKPAEPDGE